jgi:hypothetical protein
MDKVWYACYRTCRTHDICAKHPVFDFRLLDEVVELCGDIIHVGAHAKTHLHRTIKNIRWFQNAPPTIHTVLQLRINVNWWGLGIVECWNNGMMGERNTVYF